MQPHGADRLSQKPCQRHRKGRPADQSMQSLQVQCRTGVLGSYAGRCTSKTAKAVGANYRSSEAFADSSDLQEAVPCPPRLPHSCGHDAVLLQANFGRRGPNTSSKKRASSGRESIEVLKGFRWHPRHVILRRILENASEVLATQRTCNRERRHLGRCPGQENASQLHRDRRAGMLQDARRLNRRRQTMDADEEEEMREEDAAWQPAATRQSAKASFLAKVHSAVIGYNSDPQLLQFVYDLWLFTTIGGAKNASGVGIREALANKPYSPEVWRTYHTALVDLQRQIGWPSLFITIAPYEWSFPYHAWMEDRVMSRKPITSTGQNDLDIIDHLIFKGSPSLTWNKTPSG